MTRARVALATAEHLPELPAEEHLLVRALADRQVEATAAVWSDPAVTWRDFDIVVVRSTWDYHHRPAQFLGWADRLAAGDVRLWNPAPLLRWNADKTYLRDLAARDTHVVPTRWITASAGTTLAGVLANAGWEQAVVKPTVSATAYETFRVGRGDAAAHEERFRKLCARGGVMVQPYLASIETEGEWSLCFVGGGFSHAILKHPARGDFRVQVEYGGSSEQASPPAWLIDQARAVLGTVEWPWLYARVDGCVVDGSFLLLELEMLEPSLYLDRAPGAAERFADAIVGALHPGVSR